MTKLVSGRFASARRPSKWWRIVWLLGLSVAALPGATGCDKPVAEKLSPKTQTLGELRAIRGSVEVTHDGEQARAPYTRERLTDGARVRIAEGGLAWLRSDGGATLLARGPAELRQHGKAVEIVSGEVFIESPGQDPTPIEVPQGALPFSEVRANVAVSATETRATVLTGELRTQGGIVARAGERLVVQKESAKTEPEAAFDDWTGGLATANRVAERPPYGVGTVEARVPQAAGQARSSLVIQRLDVRVTIEGDFAATEVDQTFFNPRSEVVEGLYRFRVPQGGVVERFGVDRDGGIAWGYVKEKKAAAAQYQANVYQGSKEDPALLEWKGPGEYEARLYPIGPGATRRVVTRFTEWLPREGQRSERRIYNYALAADGDLASLPLIEELNVRFDLERAAATSVRVGMDGVRDENRIFIRRHDFVPLSDLSLELFDAGAEALPVVRAAHVPDTAVLSSTERTELMRKAEGERDYFLVSVPAAKAVATERSSEGTDVAIVLDASAGTSEASLALGRVLVKNVLRQLGEKDRVVLFAGDGEIRPLGPEKLTAVDEQARRAWFEGLTKLARGGASDLGNMLTASMDALTSPERNQAIVYVGDGAPTVGELSLVDVTNKLSSSKKRARVFALGLGENANMAMLDAVARGGFATRIVEERGGSLEILRLLGELSRPSVVGVTAAFNAGVERVYPREVTAITQGNALLFVGRATSKELPTQLTLTGGGDTKTFSLKEAKLADRGDLRRRWANEALGQMLAEGAGAAAIVDLGVRQGIITPFSSLYVPTASEMTSEQRAGIDRTVGVNEEMVSRKKQREERGKGDDGKRRNYNAQTGEEPDDDTLADSKNKEKAPALEEKAVAKSEVAPVEVAAAAATAAPATAAPPKAPEPEMAQPDPAPKTGERMQGVEGGLAQAPAGMASAAATTMTPPTQDMPAPPPAERARPRRLDIALDEYRSVDGNEADKQDAAKGGKDTGGTLPNGGDASGKLTGKEGRLGGQGGAFDLDNRDQDDAQQFGMIGLLEQDTPGVWGRDDSRGYIGGEGLKLEARASQMNVTVLIGEDPGRLRNPCARAAITPLGDRIALWRERLGKTQANPSRIRNEYLRALFGCEARTPRERALLISIMLDFLPTPRAQVALYRLMQNDMGAKEVVYRGILARVTTPEQMRELSQAMGIRTMDAGLLEKLVRETEDAGERVKKLREARTTYPDDLEVALRLVDAIEDTGDRASVRDLAAELRARPDADIRVRGHVAELYFRLSTSAANDEEKRADEREARRTLGEIVEFSPDDPVARRRLGDLLLSHDYFAEAARQYETLLKLTPDDPTVSLLLARAEAGQGRLEEAVKWTEKGASAGAPDAAQGPFVNAKIFAALLLSWGKLDAQTAGRVEERKALAARLARVLSGTRNVPPKGAARVIVSWTHPELRPTLMSNALGGMLPATEGDVTLGVLQTMLPTRDDAKIEVRIDEGEATKDARARAARIKAQMVVTVVWNENGEDEVISRQVVTVDDPSVRAYRFTLAGTSLVPEVVR